jgi:small subunit ribosomal protein S3
MGHKTNPTGIRLGITTDWQSRWFANPKRYKTQLRADVEMRAFIMKKWKQAAIASVHVERSAAQIRVIIETSRPGVLIGRGGTGIEDLTRAVKARFFPGKKTDLKVEVKEVKRFEENAMLVGQQIAEQLEKRIPFRRALKGMIDQVMQNKDILGVKIEISGRLGGAEMSRREWLSKGKIPLHTLRADIDFARTEAYTTYGVIGIKSWIYKGEKFEDQSAE